MECCPPEASSRPLSSAGLWCHCGRWKLKYRRCCCQCERAEVLCSRRVASSRVAMRTGCVAPNRPGLGGLEGCLFQRWKRRSFFSRGAPRRASIPAPRPRSSVCAWQQAEFAAGVRGAHERPVSTVSRGGWWGVGSRPRRHRSGHAGLNDNIHSIQLERVPEIMRHATFFAPVLEGGQNQCR